MNDNPLAVVRTVERGDPSSLSHYFFCPGCGTGHGFKMDGPGPCWTFNGDMVKPTVSPSLRVRWRGISRGETEARDHVCHTFVRDGQIQFLSDCTHALAGQTVPLEPF